ncbi:MAG: anion permease, partial [Deltaproteobacteria bacterium]|nr:anion permease [Deltaproteobacteria bacterium]
WDDVEKERKAWDTLIWFAALVMMAGFLGKLGVVPWFSKQMAGSVSGLDWITAHMLLLLVYFYAHYLFASMTAHIAAMYAPFLIVSIAAGTPPMFAALTLAFASSLHSSTTHYGTGPAPMYFGSGYVTMGAWWGLGLLVSVVNIVVWLVVGGLWWKVLGLW